MRYIFILLFICVMGHIIPHSTNNKNDYTSDFALNHPEIYRQVEISKDIPIKTIHWIYFDSLQYSKENDTIFYIQKNDIQRRACIMIWNKKDTLSFKEHINYGNIKTEKIKERMFILYMLKLVSDWDTTSIRKEELVNNEKMPEKDICALRIMFINKKCHIDYIKFNSFFNFERDRMDDYGFYIISDSIHVYYKF